MMRRKTTYNFLQIVIITVLFLLVSCGGNRFVDSKMASADSLMDACQDSAQTALAMLDSLKAQKPDMSKAQQMHYDLIYAKAMNKSFVDFTTDSVMKRVVAYYDKHGSVNERMLAYYLLGCVYRDLQDAPASLDNYYKAVELADTTSASCDYALLARIHGAMVVLYNKESSPLMSIKEAKLAAKYAWMAKDTLAAVVAYRNQVGGYYDLGNSDSVLSISLKAHDFCRKNGLATEMYHGLNAIIDVYINRKDYKRAGYYIQMMRQKADQFITPSQVRRGSELLYYNIGRYYCGIGKVDEGIGYFRKILTADHITFNQKEAAYGGLHTAYQLKGIPDSISKYAQLFVNANDSSYRHSTVESMYDYQHYQQRALKAQTENQLLWLSMALGVVVLIFVAVVVFLYICKQMKRRKAVLVGINADYNKVLDEYKRSVADLKMIENNFEQYRQKKEQEIQQMNLALNSFHQVGENENWMTEISLLDNELVNHFHAQANGVSCKISDSEWEKLKSLVEKQQPDFIRFISAPDKGLTDREYLVAILVKLHFIPSELSLLLGVGSQQITNIRSKINSKLFGKSGAKTLDANLWRI